MRNLLIIVVGGAALGQAVCSERDQAEIDLRPWDSPRAGGAKAAWQRDVKERMRNQNDFDSTR